MSVMEVLDRYLAAAKAGNRDTATGVRAEDVAFHITGSATSVH